MAAINIYSDFGAPKNKVCHCFHCFPIYSQHGEGRPALTVGIGVRAVILARARYLRGVLQGAGGGCAASHGVAGAAGLGKDLRAPEGGQGVGVGGRG